MKSSEVLRDMNDKIEEAQEAMKVANDALKIDPIIHSQTTALLSSLMSGNHASAQAIADNAMVILNKRIKELDNVDSNK